MHPTDLDRPNGIELEKFGDREQEGELFEYVQFSADVSVTSQEEVMEFKQKLKENCSDWEIGSGSNPESQKHILEMRKVIHSADDEPPLPDEVIEEQREKEAEYYKRE